MQSPVGREESTIMRRVRHLVVAALLVVPLVGWAGDAASVAGATTIGPVDVSVETPLPTEPPTDGGLVVEGNVEVGVSGGPQVGVDTSVGVSPTDGVDAKIDAEAGAGSVNVSGSVPVPPSGGTVTAANAPAPNDASSPTASTSKSNVASTDPLAVQPSGATSPPSAQPKATDRAPRVASPLDDVAVHPSEVSASLEPPRHGVWSSLGHAAATFGPWLLLIALALVVNLLAKAAIRDQRGFWRHTATETVAS
jgi:hypothetical protein